MGNKNKNIKTIHSKSRLFHCDHTGIEHSSLPGESERPDGENGGDASSTLLSSLASDEATDRDLECKNAEILKLYLCIKESSFPDSSTHRHEKLKCCPSNPINAVPAKLSTPANKKSEQSGGLRIKNDR